MNQLINFFNTRNFLVNLLAGAICAIGLFSAMTLKRDLIPPFEFNRIQVIGTLSGASAEQIEKLVTIPMEESLSSLPNIKNYDSSSDQGRASLSLIYDPGTDMNHALSQVETRLAEVKSDLPDGMDDFFVRQMKVNNVPLLGMAVKSFEFKNTQHRDWLKSFNSDIKQFKGVAKVTSNLPKIQVQIKFREADLNKYGLSQTEVRMKVAESLQFYPISKLRHKEETYNVEVDASPKSMQDILNIPLRTNRYSGSVFIKDIATIEIIEAKRNSAKLVNNEELLNISISKDINSDAIDLSEKIKKYFKKMDNPFEFELVTLYDTSKLIEKQLDVLTSNGGMGLILVACLLTLVIGFRFAIVTLLGLPVAYLGTIVILGWFDISFDLISSIAMILIIGILVDDAIIIAEKYAELLESGLSRKEASQKAASSMMAPVTGTILTTVIAFAPILFIESEVSAVFFSIPVVIISALCLSWFESFCILPNHLQHFVTSVNHKKTRAFDKMTGVYAKALNFFLKIRYVTIIAVAALFVVSGFLASELKREFNLNISSHRVRIDYGLNSASSLKEAQKKSEELYNYLDKTVRSDVTYIRTDIGSARFNGKWKSGFRYGRISLNIDQNHPRPQEFAELIKSKIKDTIEKFKENKNFEFVEIRGKRSSGEEDEEEDENQIKLYLSGSDQLSMTELETLIQGSIKPFPELKNIIRDDNLMESVWKFEIDPINLGVYKMTSRDVTTQIRGQVGINELKEIRLNGSSIMVVTTVDTLN